MPRDDAEIAAANGPRRFHELHFLDDESAGSHHTGTVGDKRHTNRHNNCRKSALQSREQGQSQNNERKRHEDIDKTLHDRVGSPTPIAAHQAQHRAHECASGGGHDANYQGDAGAIEHAAEHVATELVGHQQRAMPGRQGVFFRYPDVVGLIGSDEGTKNPSQDDDENNRGAESPKRFSPEKEPERFDRAGNAPGERLGYRQRCRNTTRVHDFPPLWLTDSESLDRASHTGYPSAGWRRSPD